ncbi:hypothetical protein WMF18_08655 [Sorangium sp. So ce315]|uniref:hypothetical protein n=1 Tax=Sorangium sp. So ce315 TaxID=3133299 RepID=UPI003F5EDEC8
MDAEAKMARTILRDTWLWILMLTPAGRRVEKGTAKAPRAPKETRETGGGIPGPPFPPPLVGLGAAAVFPLIRGDFPQERYAVFNGCNPAVSPAATYFEAIISGEQYPGFHDSLRSARLAVFSGKSPLPERQSPPMRDRLRDDRASGIGEHFDPNRRDDEGLGAHGDPSKAKPKGAFVRNVNDHMADVNAKRPARGYPRA